MANRSIEWCRVKAAAAIAVLAMVVSLVPVSNARAEPPPGIHVLLTQQDAVQAFDFNTGKGYQIGTATGLISGTTFVDFQFVPTGGTADGFTFDFFNKVTITDLDGDQIFFDNNGHGTFNVGVPPFRGSGGPLVGTYVVTGGTGKYGRWKVGTMYPYHAIATNPPAPPATGFGNVYVEVSYRDKD
jgi:hypothetical protein